MKALIQQIRLAAAEWLAAQAIHIAPKDHPDGQDLIAGIYLYFTKKFKLHEKGNSQTTPENRGDITTN